jgi:two-component system sensor histidine kinase UhpB
MRTSFANAKEHGVRQCRAGLSAQTIFGVIKAEQDFLITRLEEGQASLDIIAPYPMLLVEGYMAERENLIFRDQENIRNAFEIALKRSNNQILEAQTLAKKETESNYRKIIQAQEEERHRISRELHDEAGQAIVGIRMSLQNMKASLPKKAKGAALKELSQNIEKIIYATENAGQTIRTLAYRLRPPVLDLLGLNLAIKQLGIDFSEQTGLIISYAGMETPALSEELSISIYRIVQEALTNIVKHAGAKHAWIKLDVTGEKIDLNISDDGQGFDPKIVHLGIGLESMRERSNLLNGSMKIVSSAGEPVLLKFCFPLSLQDPTTGG